MLHHERLRPPPQDYTPDAWNLIEKNFHLEFIAPMEAVFALGQRLSGHEAHSSLQCPLTDCGQVLDVSIAPDSTTYSLRENLRHPSG